MKIMHMRRRALFGALSCVLAACGTDALSSGAAKDAASSTGDLDAAGQDQFLLPDAVVRDATVLGEFGAPCLDGRECESGYCIDSPTGEKVCTRQCGGDCPAGFECAPIANGGADRVFLCIYDRPELCKRCETDLQCDDNADLCLSIGNGRYCGEDCADDGYCPNGYECADIGGEGDAGVIARQCVPAGGAPCLPCKDDDADGYGDGEDCRGFDCDDDDPQSYEGAPEKCDNKDNNCNSMTDEPNLLEAPPAGQTCLDQGVCRGSRVTCLGGDWACDYPASFEIDVERTCDGLDNDCDGTPDEDINLMGDPQNCGRCANQCNYPNAMGVCEGGACHLGDCAGGWRNINNDNGDGCEYACIPSANGIEVCDSIDNDCDGRGDEDFDTTSDPQNCGACNRICALDHAEPACVEGACAVGRCEPGWVDRDHDARNGCEFECVLSNEGVETCDDVDNDCDGSIDEDFDKQASLEHCGGCDQACAFRNAGAVCDRGQCTLAMCTDGFYNPDLETGNGCEYQCVLTRGGVEFCDFVDNDCDSQIDEDTDLSSDAENCGACGRSCLNLFPSAVGVCLAATCAMGGCSDGYWDVNGSPIDGCEYRCDPTNVGVESCDLVDNDCDGQVDEDFDLLTSTDHCGGCGHACVLDHASPRCAGGSCFIAECADGYYDVDGDPANGCEYACTPDNGAVEACDLRDNDCDGLTDEDFDFQNSPENCGECGRACIFGGGQGICVAGNCQLSGCAVGFYDLDRNGANGCEYRCDFQSDVDLPDWGGVDANCDGIDGDVSVAIFVATTGNNANAGTRQSPVQSIGAGIALAARQFRSQVLVATGTYSETVTMREGVGIFGGFRAEQGWSRALDPSATRIAGQPTAIIAENIGQETWIQAFTLDAANANRAGQSSIAVYARDIGLETLILSHNVIHGGSAADGTNGDAGGSGANADVGGNGSAGGDGSSGGGDGGFGGGSNCNAGGRGGRGGYNGGNSEGGSPGGGGTPGGGGVGTGCTPRGNGGGAGAAGGQGGGGAAGNGSGIVAADVWIGTAGGNGALGNSGNGGGGGSGGGGTTSCTSCGTPCDLFVGCVCNADRGGGGGGGGGGGCGGNGGIGGTAGGGSFGVFLVRAHPLLEANEIHSADGGDGGRGGNGGSGGAGAGGGGAGNGADDSGTGGVGGRGGNGGVGGHGGGGSGGVSYALYTWGANPTVRGDNQLLPGVGGAGGASSGNAGRPGASAGRN